MSHYITKYSFSNYMCFSGLVTIFGNTRFLPIPFRLDISCSLFFGKLLLFIRFISLCNCIKCLFADTEWPFGVTERSFRVTERRFIMRRYNSYCRFAASFCGLTILVDHSKYY